jgi:hypothetical protein
LNCFNIKTSCSIRKHAAFASLKREQTLLHEVKGHSWSITRTASARSFCKGRSDRGSSKNYILPWAKCLCHL